MKENRALARNDSNTTRYRCLLHSIAAAVLLTGCGGGGGGGGSGSNVAFPNTGTAIGSGTTYPAAVVYALMDPGESSASMSQYAALATVDGLVYRARWRDLEPTEGNYNWSTLDAAFNAVQPLSKKLTIHVGASGGAWPAWLTSAGAITYTFNSPQGSPVIDPLPWDAIYLARYRNFVSALDAHIQSSGYTNLLNAVSVGAPVAEMSLLGCQNNMLGNVAYSRSSYLAAWAVATDSFRNRFGTATVLVSAPVSEICRPDNDGSAFYSAVMTAALATNSNLAIFAADLNALGSSRTNQLTASLRPQLDLYLQTIWSKTNDPSNRMAGTLQDAVCQGLRLGSGYFEIYKSDLLSSEVALRTAIETARTGRGC